MNRLLSLYEVAEQDNIDVDWCQMVAADSLSFRAESGRCGIAMDPWRMNTIPQETVKLAHELGHCETGSFYNRYAALDIRQKHERHADIWAIKKLIPEDELKAALRAGYREVWELADYFSVTCEFAGKALEYYDIQNFFIN